MTTKITEVPGDRDENAESTALVETTSNEISLGNALHLDKHFASSARRSTPAIATRRLTWLTGNNEAFGANGKTPLPAARGWYIDQPDEDELYPDDFVLIDAMEELCAQGLASECVVVHKDEADRPKRVPSWKLMIASLFVVCEGVPLKDAMDRESAERYGIAYAGWRQDGKSALLGYAFVKELSDRGYNGLFSFSFSSYLVDKFLGCLYAHQDYVLPFAEELRLSAGESDELAYYAYALPVQCSEKTLTAGKVKKKSKEVYYPVPAIPRLSLRTPALQEAGEEFLKSVAISEKLAYLLEDDGRVESTVEWSIERSKKLLAGDANLETNAGVVDPDGNPIESPF